MVKIGSARSNEFGGINGGKPGDQKNGLEVSTQDWYLHSKGWIVIRLNDIVRREKVAKCMEMACDNNHIGYCQSHRTSLTTEAKKYDYDVSKVKVDVETDCSELVRVCCLYAGVNISTFSTSMEVDAFRATNKAEIITDPKYCETSDYLRRGDILVTKTKGHTVVVLNDGAKVTDGSKEKYVRPAAAKKFDKELAGNYAVTTGLNMRIDAGTDKKILTSLVKGSTVRCYGYYTVFNNTKWLLVKAGTRTGFCSSKYLHKL